MKTMRLYVHEGRPLKAIVRAAFAEIAAAPGVRKARTASEWLLTTWAFVFGATGMIAVAGLPLWAILYLIFWALS